MVTAIEGKTLHFPLFGRETTPTTVQQRCVLLLQNHEEGTSLSPTCGEQRRPCDFSPRLKGHSTGMCVLAMLPDITNAMMECLVVLINPPQKMWIPHSASNLGTSKKIWNIMGFFFKVLLTGSMFGAKNDHFIIYPKFLKLAYLFGSALKPLSQVSPHPSTPKDRPPWKSRFGFPGLGPEHHPIEKKGWKSQARPESPGQGDQKYIKIWWKLVQILVNDYDKNVNHQWQYLKMFGPSRICLLGIGMGDAENNFHETWVELKVCSVRIERLWTWRSHWTYNMGVSSS